jgi:hypothetical protein
MHHARLSARTCISSRAKSERTALRAQVFSSFVFMTCSLFFCLHAVIPNGSQSL